MNARFVEIAVALAAVVGVVLVVAGLLWGVRKATERVVLGSDAAAAVGKRERRHDDDDAYWSEMTDHGPPPRKVRDGGVESFSGRLVPLASA